MPQDFARDESLFPRRETLFKQVSSRIAALIHQGKWKPGEMLPNEVELAQMFSVSQGTMRRALKMLVDTGVLIRRQGRGTFVSEFSHNENLVYNRYIRLFPDSSRDDASPTRTDLILFETVSAPDMVLDALHLPVGTQVIHAARVLCASSGLVTYDELWAVAKDFTLMTEQNLRRHDEKMLYAYYQKTCGVTITRCDEAIKAVLMPEELCRQYGLRSPLPVIEIRRTAYTYGDRPVEFHLQRSVTDRYHYKAS